MEDVQQVQEEELETVQLKDLQRPDSWLEREALAQFWLNSGKAEHASIASFALFSQKLMAIGAPTHMVSRALQCAQEEIGHAKMCFELSAAYKGEEVKGVDQNFNISYDTQTVKVSNDTKKVFQDTVLEGCLMETLSALDAARKAGQQGDPVLGAVWRRIAVEEGGHSGFAWNVVQWISRNEREEYGELLLGLVEQEAEKIAGKWPEEDVDFVKSLARRVVLGEREYKVGSISGVHTEVCTAIINQIGQYQRKTLT
eukprot:TRINITY_DN19579_c0_g1_i1.p1 TRINITY_DN19579_c0_g1~~TRINITY_DN19579_c0_g1_i1.p1  ORF type:complete len:297 (+),score=59.68 TRINITY_DN19579_c0_g1_i1:126-893(+)